MDALKKVMAEKGYTLEAAEAARASPGLMPARAILDAVQQSGPLPGGRVSRSMSDLTGAGSWYWETGDDAGYNRVDAIRRIREATTLDGDAAGARRDLIALANPGLVLTFNGAERAQEQAQAAVDELLDAIGYLSLDELANNQLGEVYDAGASSLEWFPTASRSGVAGVEVVPAEEVRIQRRGNVREYVQSVYQITLDPRTFVYSPYGTRGRDLYGMPMIVAALRELQRKETLIGGGERVIELLSHGAFLNIEVPDPTPRELGLTSERDPQYAERKRDYYRSYVRLATEARQRGVMATQAGVKATATPLTGNVGGLGDLEDRNNLKVWSSLLTLPFMRGKMDSTTQALAEVVYPILLSHAANAQVPVLRSILFGLNLHLRLRGIAAEADATFKPAPNPFLLAHAQARQAQALADAVLMEQLGPEYVQQVAEREGVDPVAVLAWREANKPAPAPLSPKAASSDVQGGNT